MKHIENLYYSSSMEFFAILTEELHKCYSGYDKKIISDLHNQNFNYQKIEFENLKFKELMILKNKKTYELILCLKNTETFRENKPKDILFRATGKGIITNYDDYEFVYLSDCL